jgi:hypothetical protein
MRCLSQTTPWTAPLSGLSTEAACMTKASRYFNGASFLAPSSFQVGIESLKQLLRSWDGQINTQQWSKRSKFLCKTAAANASGTAPRKVEPPPADYNHRHALYKQSRAYVYKHYPQLSDLAEDGTLMVVERPPDYVERREDG